jgi:hypothetical protein
MQLKLDFSKQQKKEDVQPFFSSSKMLSEEEQRLKQEALDRLCNLVELTELGYSGYGGEKILSIRKEENCLVVNLNDIYFVDD